MASRAGVINRALVHLGVATIADPNEESEQARVAALVFDDLAKSELRANAWTFAARRAQLPSLADAPVFEFARAFQLPSDYVRLIQAGDYYDFAGVWDAPVTSSRVPYRIEGRQILTDWSSPLKIRYVADLSSDPGQWDPAFSDAFAWRLAAELAPTLTKSATAVDLARKGYAASVYAARRLNAIEAPPEPVADNSWMTTRFF